MAYGVNSIPVAMLELDPQEAASFLCSADAKRRQPVSIMMSTNRGCLRFDGLLDGVSVNQGIGSVSYTAVVKSIFQNVAELYPKFPGLTADSLAVFNRTYNNSVGAAADAGGYTTKGVFFNFGYKLYTTCNIVKFLFSMVQTWVKNQSEGQLQAIYGSTVTDLAWIQDALLSSTYQQKLASATKLIGALDIKAISACPIMANEPSICNSILNSFQSENESTFAWDMLVRAFESIGLCVIVGNSQMWLAPHHGLILNPAKIPAFQQSALGQYNVAYPADYASLNLADNGYVDVSWVQPFIEGYNIYTNPYSVSDVHVSIQQIDPSLSNNGGIFIANVPDWLVPGILQSQHVHNNKDLQKISNGESLVSKAPSNDPQDEDEFFDNMLNVGAKPDLEKFKKQTDILTNWATIQLLTKKIADRTGSVLLNFTPSWTPGTSASIYTRLPGVFLRCFVDSVTHSVSVSAPNGGTASTTINYSYGRLGSTLKIDEDKVFGYTAGKMTTLQKAFVSDTTGG